MVVSSVTPLIASRCLVKKPGEAARRFLIWANEDFLFLAAADWTARPRRLRRGRRSGCTWWRRRHRRGSCWRGRHRSTGRSGRCSPSIPRGVSPLTAKTGMPAAAIAAAAWSWVEKMLQEAQRTSAPSAFSVSISTAVWMVMCSEPVMRAPFSGLLVAEFLAAGHQARHFGFGDVEFLAAPVGKRNVGDDVVLVTCSWQCSRCRWFVAGARRRNEHRATARNWHGLTSRSRVRRQWDIKKSLFVHVLDGARSDFLAEADGDQLLERVERLRRPAGRWR